MGGLSSAVSLTGDVSAGLVMRGNILPLGSYGVKGSGVAAGTQSLQAFWSSFAFSENGLVGSANTAAYPVGNFWSGSMANAGVGTDGTLAATSPFRGRAAGGRDLGADAAAVWAAVGDVVAR